LLALMAALLAKGRSAMLWLSTRDAAARRFALATAEIEGH
jgi:hypothetical protein